jgi:hypothetical protein
MNWTVFKTSTNVSYIPEKIFTILSHKGNANQNYNEITQSEWQLSRKETTLNAGKDVQERKHLYTVGKNAN